MKIWRVDPEFIAAGSSELTEAALLLRNGGVVAFPTETVYGLGADATNEAAVRKVFAAKGRPADNPLIVHLSHPSELPSVTDISNLTAVERRAMEHFWPGPLTVILSAGPNIAPSVRPELNTIGVRIPEHPVARALIAAAGCPLAAPSANQSGRPSPTTAADVIEDMEGRIDGVVDGGNCRVGVESTVVAFASDRAVIYRPGGITAEELSSVLNIPVEWDTHLSEPTATPKSPGQKYRHYAPAANVHVWWGDDAAVAVAIDAFIARHEGESVAVIAPHCTDIVKRQTKAAANLHCWSPDAVTPYAGALGQALYGLLRHFDRKRVAHILVVGVPPVGLGAAIMNRLQKAAEGRVYLV
jgi:L-threonylcarbamoyladenylate synthase